MKNRSKKFCSGLSRIIKPGKKSYLKFFNKIIFALILASGIYYIVSINDLSIKGFVLQELKLKSSELYNTEKIVKVKIMELESFENIEKRAISMNLVKADKIDYITVGSEGVAIK